MADLKAIQTAYKGYKFRSRIEARWAVFFDALGIKWEYEREGFDLPEVGAYLPDFWLPDFNCWIEIKGDMPTKDEGHKCAALARESECDVYLFFGSIPIPTPRWYEQGTQGAFQFTPDVPEHYELSAEYLWCACPVCGEVEITRMGWMHLMRCHGSGLAIIHEIERMIQDVDSLRWWMHKRNDVLFGGDHPRLLGAFEIARRARFEHGEQP